MVGYILMSVFSFIADVISLSDALIFLMSLIDAFFKKKTLWVRSLDLVMNTLIILFLIVMLSSFLPYIFITIVLHSKFCIKILQKKIV